VNPLTSFEALIFCCQVIGIGVQKYSTKAACDMFQSFHLSIAAFCTGWNIGKEIFPPSHNNRMETN